MNDFKNIAKIFGVLFLFFVWLTFAFRWYETDDDVKLRILKQESPKCYDFRILAADEYRGYNFLGMNPKGDTVRDTLSSFWKLYQQYRIGDRIIKKKGNPVIMLVKQNGDTTRVHLFYKGDDITMESKVNDKLK